MASSNFVSRCSERLRIHHCVCASTTASVYHHRLEGSQWGIRTPRRL